MNKGQFPIALVGLIFVIMILKMPSEDVSKLVFKLFDALIMRYIFGYVAAVVAIGGWFIHSKWQRRIITVEMKRIARERDKWQRQILGNSGLQSSE